MIRGNSEGLWLTPDRPTLETGYRFLVGSAFSCEASHPGGKVQAAGNQSLLFCSLEGGRMNLERGEAERKGFFLGSFEKQQQPELLRSCPTVGRRWDLGVSLSSCESRQGLWTLSLQRGDS